nr:unnamed protein product [Digitaria exilis]
MVIVRAPGFVPSGLFEVIPPIIPPVVFLWCLLDGLHLLGTPSGLVLVSMVVFEFYGSPQVGILGATFSFLPMGVDDGLRLLLLDLPGARSPSLGCTPSACASARRCCWGTSGTILTGGA